MPKRSEKEIVLSAYEQLFAMCERMYADNASDADMKQAITEFYQRFMRTKKIDNILDE